MKYFLLILLLTIVFYAAEAFSQGQCTAIITSPVNNSILEVPGTIDDSGNIVYPEGSAISINVEAQLSQGTFDQLAYIQLEYRPIASSIWIVLAYAENQPYLSTWVPLTVGSFIFRAIAFDRNGIADSNPSESTVTIQLQQNEQPPQEPQWHRRYGRERTRELREQWRNLRNQLRRDIRQGLIDRRILRELRRLMLF